MDWARFHSDGYECSSAGDQRFSALFAVLPDGRTIEEAYQLDVKGYRALSSSWRDGKGKPPINGKTQEQLWVEYFNLWQCWVVHNPADFQDLIELSRGKVLTDKFATGPINQARALAELVTWVEWKNSQPFDF